MLTLPSDMADAAEAKVNPPTPPPLAPDEGGTPFFGGVGSLLRKAQHALGGVGDQLTGGQGFTPGGVFEASGIPSALQTAGDVLPALSGESMGNYLSDLLGNAARPGTLGGALKEHTGIDLSIPAFRNRNSGTRIGESLGDIPLAGSVARRAFDIAGSPVSALAPFGAVDLGLISAGGVGAHEAARRADAPEWLQTGADIAGSIAGGAAGGIADTLMARPPEIQTTLARPRVSEPDALPFGKSPLEAQAAFERSQGNVRPVDALAVGKTPEQNLIQRIKDAKPLQEQNKELLSELRARQAGAYSGTLQSGPGGVEGALQAKGALRGAAERVTFQPLGDYIGADQWDALADTVTGHPSLRPFEKANAVDALLNIRDGIVPDDYDLKQLERVFPGTSQALRDSKIMSIPKVPIDLSLSGINNAVRSSNTLFDYAALGRLGPQAGLYDPEAFGKAWVTGYVKAVKDPSIVDRAIAEIDARSSVSSQVWKESGLRVANPDADPGLLGNIPGLGRVVNGYRNFQRLIKPQMANNELELRIASGDLPASAAHDPTVLADIAKGTNVVSGSTNAPISEDANFLLRFPNWLLAQYELIGRAAFAPVSPTIANQMALKSLTRLITFGVGTTAALNALSGRPTKFRNGVPMANIPDYITEHLGMPKGTTVDMFGPLGEIASKTVGLGGSVVKGAGTGGARGAVSGGGKGLYQLYDGLASPVASLGMGLARGQDAYGHPTRNLQWVGKQTLPFASDVILGTDTRSPATSIASSGGLRLHEPSARDQFAQVHGAPDWDHLEPSVQKQYVPENPTVTQQQVADLTKVQSDRVAAAEKAMQVGVDSHGVVFGPKQFRETLQDARATLSAQKAVVYRNAKTAPGKDPVLDGYYQVFDSTIDPATNKPDGDALDAYVASLKPDERAYLDRNTGLTFTDNPTVKQYESDVKQIEQSGYWKLNDAAAQTVAAAMDIPKVKTEAQLKAGIAQKAQAMAEGNPLAEHIIEQRLMERFDQIVGREHTRFLMTPEGQKVGPLLVKWGYNAPRAAYMGQ